MKTRKGAINGIQRNFTKRKILHCSPKLINGADGIVVMADAMSAIINPAKKD